jgi:outer membrane protein OmpA-like peptidoglycan-associated protein
LALTLASTTPATAQVIIGGTSRPEVVVDTSVLDRLGGEQTLPDMFLNRHPPAPLAPLTAAPRPRVSVTSMTLAPHPSSNKVVTLHKPSAPVHKTAAAKAKPEVKVVKASTAPQVAELPNPEPAAKPVEAPKVVEAPKPVEAPKVAAAPVKPVEAPKPAETPKVVAAPKPVDTPPPAKTVVATATPDTAPAKPADAKPAFKVPPAISTAPPPPIPVVQPPSDPTPVRAPVAEVQDNPAPAATVPPMVVTGPPITPPPAAPPLGTAAAPAQQQARLTPAPATTANGDSTILFEPDGAILPPASRDAMTALSKRMASDASIAVQLLAYAEGDEDNASKARRLSLSRALAVRSFLIDQGVRSTRIEVRALGNKVPDGPPDRVDVVVQKR